MQKRTIALPCAIPGTETTVTAFCYGPQDAQRHIYLQGSLHADEMPGSLVAYHLCQRLDKLEAQGALQARITVVPLCNTAGLRLSVLFSGVGRFDMAIGQNYNRLRTVPFYERVLARLQQNPQALGQDAQANRTTIRAAMRAEGWRGMAAVARTIERCLETMFKRRDHDMSIDFPRAAAGKRAVAGRMRGDDAAV